MTPYFNPDYQQFQDKTVRELAWVLASPPLLHHPSFLPYSWFQEQYNRSLPWLNTLDKNPEPLQQFLKGKNTKRLGKYFESLLEFWFTESRLFSIILSNYQLVDKKQTIGELDFIVKENASGKVYHLEVAVKFYIQDGSGKEFMQWIGPNAVDRLAFKYDKLSKKQLKLLDHPKIKDILSEYNIHEIERKSILKGFLFYDSLESNEIPDSFHKQHLRGKKYFYSQFLQWSQVELSFLLVEKPGWFSIPETNDNLEWMTIDQAKQYVCQRMAVIPMSFMLIAYNEALQETYRIMIVPNSWPESNILQRV